jgi:tRNA (cmo5U34)-methyltransferase
MQENDNLTAHSASSYDDHVRESIPNYDAFHVETINLVAAYLRSPGLWLDTGCGTGTLVLKAYSQFPNTRFILADPSLSMLELAKLKLAGKERASILSPIETRHLDLLEKADVITAIQAHHYGGPDDRRASTRKCFDLLAQDGIFITFENIRPLTDAGTEIGKKYWQRYQERAGKSQEEARRHLNRFGKEYRPITVEEHLDLLRACSFKVVEILWYSYLQAGFYCIK